MRIYRYDTEPAYVTSNVDLIDNLLNLVSSLKSSGHTYDLLREIHKFPNAAETKKVSTQISLHADMAVELARQGLDSRPEISFLPLYYSALNLAKVTLLFLGQRKALEKNKWHGAVYRATDMNRSFFDENILVKSGGVVPLMFSATIGGRIPAGGLRIPLVDVYGRIRNITSEYRIVAKKPPSILAVKNTIVRDETKGHFLQVEFCYDDQYFRKPPISNQLSAYHSLSLFRSKNDSPCYRTKRIKEDFEKAATKIVAGVKRHLLSEVFVSRDQEWVSYVPLSAKKHVFSEDMNILLAFFHLSNIVRYNPQHLEKIMDSKYCLLILALRKDGYLRMLNLFWGNVMRQSFDIKSD